jgi:hypothetical protein
MERFFSGFLKFNVRDLLNAIIITFLGTFLGSLVTLLEERHLPTSDQVYDAFMLGLVAAATYLAKNLLSGSNGQFLHTEKKIKKDNENI